MLNLYTNEHRNGFMGLVGKNTKAVTIGLRSDSGNIISGIEVLSFLVLFAIAFASQYQTSVEQQRYTPGAAYSTVS